MRHGGYQVNLVNKIISGGQTGVDRAALDVATELGIPIGGWCPKGRRAEDGPISAKYPLKETPHEDDAQRTEWNVRDSDGTLIISPVSITGGTALTRDYTRKYGRPCLLIRLKGTKNDATRFKQWVQKNKIATLNVAGPRETDPPKIYPKARMILRQLIKESKK